MLPINGNPDSKVHGTTMGPIWGQQDPGGPHVGPMNIAIWEYIVQCYYNVVNFLQNPYKRQVSFVG